MSLISTDKGFTVLEAVIALALAALIITVSYSAFFGIEGTIAKVNEERDVLETGRILLSTIKKDLRGIAPASKYPLIITRTEREDSPAVYSMDFVGKSAIGHNPFGYSEIGYYLVFYEDNKTSFIRRESKFVDSDIKSGGHYFELTDMVKSFTLSFYDGKAWTDTWDTRSGGLHPKQIRISLVLVDDKGISKTFEAEETIASAM